MIMTKDSHGNYVKIEDIKQQDSFTGISPIDFKSNGDNLKNYRIYGNTVNGENVGDRTANLFDENAPVITTYIRNEGNESIGANGDKFIKKVISVTPNTMYTISWGSAVAGSEGNLPYVRIAQYNAAGDFINRLLFNSETKTVYSQKSNVNAVVWDIRIDSEQSDRGQHFVNFMLNSGSEPQPYEPYGYRVPVTITNGTDTQTTNIYLPEPIKRVGDEAEYIDYGEQKQHKVRKNLLQNTATSQTINGLTFTVNTDGSVTCNGKRENTTTFFTIANVTTSGKIILSGCPSGGSSTSFAMRAFSATVSNPRVYYDIGDSCMLNTPDTYNIDIRIQSNYACDNLTFYPMIRKADIEDDTYEPYIENTEVDVTLPALPTATGTNTLSVNTNIKPSKVWGGLNDPRDILYVKDKLGNILFSKYYEIEDEPPLTYKAKKAGTLKNYRIYGNTVGGESVGDLVESGENAEEYKVLVTVEGKNLLPRIATSQTINGVTFTANDDGSVTCNGTATATTAIVLLRNISISNSTILSGCPVNGGVNSYLLRFISLNPTVIDEDVGLGKTITNFRTGNIEIRVAKDYTCDNITFYPMIRLATIEDDTYEPYRTPVTTSIYLSEQIRKVGDEAEYIDFKEQKQYRVRKNLLQNTATSQTKNGVTFTVNSDGSVTCNGTASDAAWFVLNKSFDTYAPDGRIASIGNNGSTSTFYMNISYIGNITSSLYFSRTIHQNVYVQLVIAAGYTCNNLTFYPMIRKAGIEDDTYEPYIENTYIDVTIPALPTLSGTNTLSVETEVQPSDIYLKGKIEKKPKIYYKIYYYSQDGQTLLYTESVLKGSDGMYSGTPTKIADPQYTYTFAGWSSSTGQTTATPEVRNNIQNDKNVYAAFSQTLNTYTVYFYNESDTPVETVQNVPYGGTATYTESTPTKSGYRFTGWNPDPTNITANTSCYAQFEEVLPYITDSWETISQRSAAGTAQNYYSVGDCKPVYLSGTMGTLALDTTLYVYILGFNHNSALEGNGITFGGFKTAATNGIDVCLVDSKYGSSDTSGTKYFNMSHRGNYNYGGWKGSDMRYDILGSTDVQPSGYGSTPTTSKVGYNASSTCATNPVANTLMSCLPSDLRAVMKPMTKYTDNKGNKSNTSTNVTFSIDYLPLLSEFEIQGIRIYANQYEQDKQAKYAYYNAGNSKVKYQHSSASSAANWWFRSACYDSSSDFCCYVSTTSGEYVNRAHKASGVAPCFLV